MTVRDVMNVLNLRDTQVVEAVDFANRQTYRTIFGYSFSAEDKEALMGREVRLMYFGPGVLTLILKEDRDARLADTLEEVRV